MTLASAAFKATSLGDEVKRRRDDDTRARLRGEAAKACRVKEMAYRKKCLPGERIQPKSETPSIKETYRAKGISPAKLSEG